MLSVAVTTLKETEGSNKIELTDMSAVIDDNDTKYSLPPHRGQEIFQVKKMDELYTWGNTVELLWEVAMSCEAQQDWNALTYRLLVWRSIVGSRATRLGEWARKEAIRCTHPS